jgi:TolA-binding protein
MRTLLSLLLTLAFTIPSASAQADKDSGKLKKAGFSLDRYDQSQFDERARRSHARMSSIRQKKIQNLEGIIKSNRPYKNKADVLFRLAEAHRGESKYRYMLRRDVYDKAMECYDEKRCTQEPPEPNEDFSVSLDYYRQVLSNFPTYRRIDEVMYYLGRAALRAGKTRKDVQLQKEGVKYLDDLVQLHQKSKLIAKAYLSLGEHHFETDNLYSAKNAYEKIVFNYKRSSMFNYALYKLGWVYFNLAEFEKTVKTFQQVVASIGKGANRARIEFRSQALNDLIVTWVEIDDGWKAARPYFLKEVGEVETYKKLEKMAGLLVGKDKSDEAIDLYNHLIEHDKVNASVVEYMDAILEIRHAIGSVPELETFINRFLTMFDKKAKWHASNQRDSELLDRVDEIASTQLHWLANQFHVTAEKNQKKRLPHDVQYSKAAKYYSQFINLFPEHKKSYRVSYDYAEILYWELNDYARAAEQYERVIERDTKGKYMESAAYNVVFCMEKLMVKEGLKKEVKGDYVVERKKNKKGLKDEDLKEIPRTPLHNLEERFIAAADTYVRLLKDAVSDPVFMKKNPKRGAKIPNMMYIAARTFYRHGDFKNAVSRLMVIFDLYPKHKYASIAVNDIIDAYVRLKHWEKIEEWARKLIRTRNFAVKTKSELEDMIAKSKNYQAVDFMKERNYDEAIRVQQELVDEFGKKNKSLAAQSLVNIAIIYDEARRFPEAVATFEEVIKRYKKEKVASQAQFEIAVLYEKQTKFAKAAEAFIRLKEFKDKSPKECALYGPLVELLPEDHPDRKARPARKCVDDAIRNASLLYAALGQNGEAHKAGELYVKTFKKYFKKYGDVKEVAFNSADVLQQQGDKKGYLAAAKKFQKIARTFGKKDLAYQLKAITFAGIALKKADKLKNRGKASKLFRKTLELYRRLNKAPRAKKGQPAPQVKLPKGVRGLAGRAQLELAEYAYDDYAKIRIKGLDPSGRFSIRMLKKTLIAKAKSLESTQSTFGKVLEFKDPGIAAAAAFRGGQLYYEFANNLFNADVPPSLDEEQTDEYRYQLEEYAQPVQAKALAAFTAALRAALQKNVYNKWSRMSAEYAAKVNKAEFPISTFSVKPNKTKDTVQSTSFIRSVRRGNTAVDFTKEVAAKTPVTEPKNETK